MASWIYVSIFSGDGLSLDRRQANILKQYSLIVFGLLGTNFSEILVEIQAFHWKRSIWKYRLQNVAHFV